MEISESEKGEFLDLTLEYHNKKEAIKRHWTKVFADLIVEEQIKNEFNNQKEDNSNWDRFEEVVNLVIKDRVILPGN